MGRDCAASQGVTTVVRIGGAGTEWPGGHAGREGTATRRILALAFVGHGVPLWRALE